MGVATVFEVEIPASALALAETFECAPDAEVRLERTVGGPHDPTPPFVWFHGVEADRIADLLAADGSVAAAEKFGEDSDAHLYEVTFDAGICSFVEAIFERGGVVVRATATDGVWTFQLRFADRSDVGEVFDDEFIRTYEATVTRLYGSSDAPSVRAGVTEKQRRALEIAFEMGYYAVPRDVDLRSVGKQLGVSRQAVSERLRRAHEMLVADFLGEREP
jgi:predicted DNA binding protein